MYMCIVLEFPHFVDENRNLTQHIIHTHFLQTVFSTVHYMILLCQIPSEISVVEKMRKLKVLNPNKLREREG